MHGSYNVGKSQEILNGIIQYISANFCAMVDHIANWQTSLF